MFLKHPFLFPKDSSQVKRTMKAGQDQNVPLRAIWTATDPLSYILGWGKLMLPRRGPASYKCAKSVTLGVQATQRQSKLS
jgi:hypothetical protein